MLPDLSKVDFTDAAQVTGSGHLLLSLLQSNQSLSDPRVDTPLLAELRDLCRQWIALTESNIRAIPQADVLRALGNYDLIYRVAFQRPDDHFYHAQFQRVFRAMERGNSSIAEEELASVISHRQQMWPRFVDQSQAWLKMIFKEWIDELNPRERLLGLPSARALRRAGLLLRSDLGSLVINQPHFKAALSRKYLSALTPAGLAHADTETLYAAMAFLLGHQYGLRDFTTTQPLYLEVLRLLSQARTLDPNERRAFALDYSYHSA